MWDVGFACVQLCDYFNLKICVQYFCAEICTSCCSHIRNIIGQAFLVISFRFQIRFAHLFCEIVLCLDHLLSAIVVNSTSFMVLQKLYCVVPTFKTISLNFAVLLINLCVWTLMVVGECSKRH